MPKRVDRVARREEILAAAVRVFARRGYAATRIDDVAREAGIAKGSVYLYFEGREQLLHAAFEDLATRSASVLRTAAQGEGPAAERLAGLVHGALTALPGDRDLARVLLDLWSAGRHAQSPLDLAAAYRDHRAVVAALLHQAREEGVRLPAEPEDHAAVLVGAVEGCMLQWLFDPAVDPVALAEPVVRLLVPSAGQPSRHGREPDRTRGQKGASTS